MTDWRKLSIGVVLANGKIDSDEVKILKKELFPNGRFATDEVKYLVELRSAYQKRARATGKKVNPQFEKFFFSAVEKNVLANGKVEGSDAVLLRKMIFADKMVDPGEKKLLTKLKRTARKTSPAFDRLYKDCMKKK
jgi:hypothetical protein